MGELFPFLTRIFDALVMFIPHFVILNTTEGGVKWTHGSKIKCLMCNNGMWWPRGMFLFWPISVWLCFYQNRWRTNWEDWWSETGIHWYWPLVTHEPTRYFLPRQSVDVEKQILTTEDGHTLYVNGIFVYEIWSPLLFATKCQDQDKTAKDYSKIAIWSAFSSSPFDWLKNNPKQLKKKLTKRLRKRVHKFGINVLEFSLSDFSTGEPLVHMTDFDSRPRAPDED